MKRLSRTLSLLMVLIMALSATAFCEDLALTDYEEPMVLSAYLGTGTLEPQDQENNALVQFIKNKFNIDISGTQFLTGDRDQELGLMIASGEMPDVVVTGTSPNDLKIVHQFVEAGMLLETEDLLRKSPNIMQDLNETAIDYFREEDGKLYAVPSYGINPENTETQYSSEPNLTWFKRTDLFEKLGIEDPKTPDDLYEALKKISELDAADGTKYIPLQGADASFYEIMIGGMFGVWTHRKDINEEEQRFTRKEEFPEYVDFLKYMAKLYREGLVDPELFMTDQSVAISRQREARVGIGITWPNDIDVLEVAAQQVDPETRYNAFRMPRVEGLENTQYWQTLTLPNYCTLISAKAKDPERIMKFLDWQVSTEGWLCMCYGAPTTDVAQGCWYEEGDQYYYDQAARDEYTAKDPTYENQVLGGWTYMMAGRYVYHINHQGFANVTESPDKQRMEAREYNMPEVFMDTEWELVQKLPEGPVAAAKSIAVDKVFNDGYQKIIMEAKDDDEVQAMYDEMIENAISAGLRDIEKEQYERYQLYLKGEL